MDTNLEKSPSHSQHATSCRAYYVIRKAKGKDWTFQFLQRMAMICQVATVDQAVVSMALSLNFTDFEDAIQYSTAVSNHLDAIVTRNPQDFVEAALPIMTPDSGNNPFCLSQFSLWLSIVH